MNSHDRGVTKEASRRLCDLSIDDLLSDERLRRLFSGEDLHCALQLWILQLKHSSTVESRILYGRLVPYSFSNAKWSASDREKFQSFAGVNAQVIRLSIYVKSSACAELTRLLASGMSISELSEILDLELGSDLAMKVGGASLAPNGFVCRPVAFLLNRDSHRSGILSPHSDAGALSASISRIDKPSLFLIDERYVPELVAHAASRMSQDTGLDFARSDNVRFGDLELLAFPALSDQEQSLLDVKWVDERRGLAVRFDPAQLNQVATVRFRVSIENAGNVLHAATARASLDEAGNYVHTFAITGLLSEQNDSAEVEVYWTKSGLSDEEVLCCRWGCDVIREISLRGGVVGAGATVIKSDWLQKSIQREDLKVRADAVMTVKRRTPSFNDIIGGRKADPWVPVNREMSALFSKIYPVASGGGFFERSGIGDKAGRLEFAEWFKKLLTRYGDHQVVIFDPYFDTAGLDLVLASASEASDYLIFTSLPRLKHQAEQGDGVAEEQESDEAEEIGNDEAGQSIPNSSARSRLQNLLSSCESSRELMAGVKLRIFGMAARRLHDRYILVVGNDGLPVAGFNLSNSMQAAAQNHPLLVTPIPADLLPRVNQYKEGLVREVQATDEAQQQTLNMRLLFESGASPTVSTPNYDPLRILEHDRAGDVIGAWVADPSFCGLSGDQLTRRMRDVALILEGKLQLPISGVIRCVQLPTANCPDFSGSWEVLAWLMAHSPAGDEDFPEIGQEASFLQFLVEHLHGAVLLDPEELDAEIASTDAGLIPKTLGDLLRSPYRAEQLVHYTRLRPLRWTDYYAIKLLWVHDADALLTLFEGWVDQVRQVGSNAGSVRFAALNQVLSNISWSIQFGLSGAQQERLLGSSVGLLKWMGVGGLFELLREPDGLRKMLAQLAVLSQSEQVQVLGSFIQRSSSGRSGVDHHSSLIDAMHDLLPATISARGLRSVVDSMRGHMGSLAWAEPWLFDDLVFPLLQKGRVKYDDVAGIWQQEVMSMLGPLKSGAARLFNSSREGRSLNVAAFLFANSEVGKQRAILRELEAVLGRCRRVIQQPLASTSSWVAWDDALAVSMWVLAYSKCAELHLRRVGRVNSDLTSLSDIAQLLLGARSERERRVGASGGRRALLDLLDQAEDSLADDVGS